MTQHTPAPLVEGRDYYMENGLLVLTELFLRSRGYCCRNGCRHCPYGYTLAPPTRPVSKPSPPKEPS